ncbi:MAG: NADH:flavin oxidoreductase, partial [Pseudomonadota bacterium]
RELDADHVFIATGAHWRADGIGRNRRTSLPGLASHRVLSPDALMAGEQPVPGPVVVYDDDQCYLAAVLAEHLAIAHEVTYVTPAPVVSAWTEYTLEQSRVHRRLLELGVRVVCGHTLSGLDAGDAVLDGVYGEPTQRVACVTLVPVTERVPNDALFHTVRDSGLRGSVELVGDALCPALIADAVFDGHRAARNLGRDPDDVEREYFTREMPSLDACN